MDFSTLPVDVLRIIIKYKYEIEVSKRKRKVMKQLKDGYFRFEKYGEVFIRVATSEHWSSCTEHFSHILMWCPLCNKRIGTIPSGMYSTAMPRHFCLCGDVIWRS